MKKYIISIGIALIVILGIVLFAPKKEPTPKPEWNPYTIGGEPIEPDPIPVPDIEAKG